MPASPLKIFEVSGINGLADHIHKYMSYNVLEIMVVIYEDTVLVTI
jgi:hypothetical protein